jgi:hypothetical protein
MATRRAAQSRLRANKGVASFVPLGGAPAAATFDVQDLVASSHGEKRCRRRVRRSIQFLVDVTPELVRIRRCDRGLTIFL